MMIKNISKFNEFNKETLREEKISHEQAMLIYDSLYREAAALGVLDKWDVMESIEVDLRIARALNSIKK